MLRLFSLLVLLATAATVSAQSERDRVLAIIGASNAAGIALNADFASAPAGTLNWEWRQQETVEEAGSAATQQLHQGLARFNWPNTPTNPQWIDLSTDTGANSCGATLGQFGGLSGSYGHSINQVGVTIEMVVKFHAIDNWAKPFDFNTGPGVDEMTWTWDGDSDGVGRFLIEQYVNASRVPADFDKGAMEFFRPALNQWYHLTQVMVPDVPGGEASAVWYIYVNGQKLALADALIPGASHTPLQSANYPLRITRPYQYIARSGWAADPYMKMTVDALRVYDFKLSDEQIGRLATMYGLNNNDYAIPAPSPAGPATTESQKLSHIPFAPAYSLDFETNPASAVGGTINWQWLESDPTDTAADQARHRGIAKLNGGANNFIDLMKASGPQSAGKVIPTLFTNSPGDGAAHGWTIEMVVRPDAIQTWSKYFCMGTGPYYDAIYIGWIGGDNLWEGASYNNIRDQLRPFNPGQLTFYRAPTLGKWTHLTWVIRPLNIGNHPLANYSASWSMFVDGELVTRSTTNANYPLPLVRRQAYLGASVWPADVPARIAVDAFRVWDRALSAEQIQTITTNYGIENSNGGDWNWNRALGTAPRPVYDLDFQQNPTDGANEQPVAWVWSEQDPADSTVVAGLHTGLAIFDGTANSWVNLSANVGPNRVPVPMVMPNPIGGIPTQRPGYQQGWSFETVVKSTAWRGWSKFFVISNGADEDEIILGYDGSGDNIILQNYIRDAVWDGRWNYAESELRRPFLLNKWYHIVLTFLPGTIEGGGNWRLYINGEQLDWASDITPNMTLTELQGATYPRESIRTQSFLGKSTWNDPTSRLLVDAFRIYDYALTLQQVQLFSQAYGTYEVPPRFPADQPISVSQESQNWQSAPGITRAPIFNGVFSVNPVTYVGGRTDYQWMEVDPADDPATQNLHKGLLVFNGSDAAWADLTVATGPKSIGQVMPMVGGRGSGTGAQRGMTFELVVKLTAVEQWAKLIQLAAGPGQDSLIIGWNNDRPFNTIEVHNMARVKPGLQRTGAVDLMSQPPLNQWLFITVVMQLTDDVNWRGSWVAYESGNVIARHDSTASTNPANFPMKVHRQYATFAKSAWDSDSTATMLLDMARIYDYALTEEQVRASVSLYGMYGSSRPVQTPTNVTLPMPDTDESVRARAAVTRAPVFNAWFPTDPAQQVNAGRALSYRWLDFDPADSVTERANHRGIIDLSGDPNSYIDMNTNAGPNSCGVVVPIIGGPGSATGADAGWTFELVFKIKTMISWVKLFNLGNGPELNNIILGVDGTDHTTMAFEVFDREVTAWSHGFAELFQPEMNRWYHVVIQVVPTVNTTQGAGIWYFYVNGNLLAYTDKIVPGTSFTPVQGASYPKAVYRRNSYIGKSNWNDPTFQGYLDAFRIYDYRLTATQIRNLADVYGLANSPVRLPSVADNNPNVNPASQPEVRAWDRDGIPEPVFNGNFAVDPRIALEGATSSFEYSWMSTDPADTPADQNVHKGMIHLNNAVSSWIQLSKATGSRSVGLVIPTLFDVPQADEGRADRGWTVEVVCKLHRQEVWSKIVNFATGGSDWMDSWAITWNGDNRNRLTVQNYNNLNPVPGQPNELGFQDFLTSPVLNKWYHLVIVMQPYGPKDRYAARWRMYVDGVLMQTAEQNMPLPVVREDSFIGASQWGDQDPKQMMLVDALRIYNKGLSSAQVRSLAMMYGNNPPQPAQDPVLPPVLPPVDPGSFPPAPDAPSGNGGGDASSSSKSKLSGGAIAGIVIGSVVGAAILCLILFCLFAGGSRMGGSHKATSDPYKGEGKYGQMEASKVEESQTGEVHDEEIEMGETNA